MPTKRIQQTAEFQLDGARLPGAWAWRADQSHVVTFTVLTVHGPALVRFARCLLAAGLMGAAQASTIRIGPGDGHQLRIDVHRDGETVAVRTDARTAERFLQRTVAVIPQCENPAGCSDGWCMECRTVRAEVGDETWLLGGAL